jgi:hypothetical protein
VRPSTFTSEKSGAWVPSGNIVLGVRTIAKTPRAIPAKAKRLHLASISDCDLHGK